MTLKGVESALAAFDMMVELKPANIVEAMLTVQMVGVHEAALRFLMGATLEGQTFEGSGAAPGGSGAMRGRNDGEMDHGRVR